MFVFFNNNIAIVSILSFQAGLVLIIQLFVIVKVRLDSIIADVRKYSYCADCCISVEAYLINRWVDPGASRLKLINYTMYNFANGIPKLFLIKNGVYFSKYRNEKFTTNCYSIP